MKPWQFVTMIALLVATGAAWAHDDAQPIRDGKAEPDEMPFGRPGEARGVSRTVRIVMSDKLRFTPARINLRQNETVRFVVKNSGSQMHELVLGTLPELRAHAAIMRKHPGMEHDELHMAHVPPGKSRSLIWQFTKAGEFHYGCLLPGHFEGGMVGKIVVR